MDSRLHELREFIQRSKWTLCQEFIDQSYTGSNTKRPDFTEVMSQARKRSQFKM